ncbi:hydrogenase maturation factor HypB-like [Macrobrachium rosenbergii]|uniref:hydrogenase maturation factor HypB-like n=1 Tax=Macrobrachium rosenbergii TaxID=79674 RepID=UPI0034D71922
MLKVVVWLTAMVVAALAFPDGHQHNSGYHAGGHHHNPGYHGGGYHHNSGYHDNYDKPYEFDYKAVDYYGGSHHHAQKFDGHKKEAAYDVYFPDGKSTLSVQVDGYDQKAAYDVYYPDGKSTLTVKLGH